MEREWEHGKAGHGPGQYGQNHGDRKEGQNSETFEG